MAECYGDANTSSDGVVDNTDSSSCINYSDSYDESCIKVSSNYNDECIQVTSTCPSIYVESSFIDAEQELEPSTRPELEIILINNAEPELNVNIDEKGLLHVEYNDTVYLKITNYISGASYGDFGGNADHDYLYWEEGTDMLIWNVGYGSFDGAFKYCWCTCLETDKAVSDFGFSRDVKFKEQSNQPTIGYEKPVKPVHTLDIEVYNYIDGTIYEATPIELDGHLCSLLSINNDIIQIKTSEAYDTFSYNLLSIKATEPLKYKSNVCDAYISVEHGEPIILVGEDVGLQGSVVRIKIDNYDSDYIYDLKSITNAVGYLYEDNIYINLNNTNDGDIIDIEVTNDISGYGGHTLVVGEVILDTDSSNRYPLMVINRVIGGYPNYLYTLSADGGYTDNGDVPCDYHSYANGSNYRKLTPNAMPNTTNYVKAHYYYYMKERVLVWEKDCLLFGQLPEPYDTLLNTPQANVDVVWTRVDYLISIGYGGFI